MNFAPMYFGPILEILDTEESLFIEEKLYCIILYPLWVLHRGSVGDEKSGEVCPPP